ncbi:DUF885 domain-containing protein [Candidatus Bipolaricaulota bacterium]|nr:DUF885 domain-containing protein [Candidatus Bipolaricaulota bacterium]
MRRKIPTLAYGLVMLLLIPTALAAEPSPSWSPPLLDELLGTLSGLSIDEFVEQASKQLLLRMPTRIIAFGLADQLQVRNDRLTPTSNQDWLELQAMARAIDNQLSEYESADFTLSQRISAETLHEILQPIYENSAASPTFWPFVNPTATCELFQLDRFFEFMFPRTSADDLEDFITILWQVDDMIDGWMEEIEQAATAGILPPRTMGLQATKDLLITYREVWNIEQHPYYSMGMDLLTSVEKLPEGYSEDFGNRLVEVISDSIAPAFNRLYQKLDILMHRAPWTMNWQKHAAWPEYYRQVLRHTLGTAESPEAIHAAAIAEVMRLSTEIRSLSNAAVDTDAPIASLVADLHDKHYHCSAIDAQQLLDTVESLMSAAYQSAGSLFQWAPEQTPAVIFGNQLNPCFTPSPFDESKAATFIIPQSTTYNAAGLAVMVYHETIPGHDVQTSVARQQDIPLIQQLNGWLGYSEGWAEYACRLADDAGWYDADPCSRLAFLEQQLTFAAMTAIETGLLGLEWSLQESVAYAQTIFDVPANALTRFLSDFFYEPAKYTVYFVGRIMILEQRARAMGELGNAFSLAEFHQAILQYGNIPLRLIEELVDDYIARVKEGSPEG